MIRLLFSAVVIFLASGCASSLVPSIEPDRNELNESIQNENVVLNLKDGSDVRAHSVRVGGDSVCFVDRERDERRTMAIDNIRSIKIPSNLNVGTLIGIGTMLGGSGMIASAAAGPNTWEGVGKVYAGMFLGTVGLVTTVISALVDTKRYRIENCSVEMSQASDLSSRVRTTHNPSLHLTKSACGSASR